MHRVRRILGDTPATLLEPVVRFRAPSSVERAEAIYTSLLLPRHHECVLHYLVVPTADGTRLMTRGSDGKLVILDLVTGKRLYEWAFDEQLGGVAITTDGRHVAVGLATGVIYVLRIDPAKKPG